MCLRKARWCRKTKHQLFGVFFSFSFSFWDVRRDSGQIGTVEPADRAAAALLYISFTSADKFCFFHTNTPLVHSSPLWFAVISPEEYRCCLRIESMLRGKFNFTCCFILESYRLLYAINWGNFDNCSVVGFIHYFIQVKLTSTCRGNMNTHTSSSCIIWLDETKDLCRRLHILSHLLLFSLLFWPCMRRARFCIVDVKKDARLSLKPNDLLYESKLAASSSSSSRASPPGSSLWSTVFLSFCSDCVFSFFLSSFSSWITLGWASVGGIFESELYIQTVFWTGQLGNETFYVCSVFIVIFTWTLSENID